MSTKLGILLSNITAHEAAPFREVIRVVSINEHGKLCLPAREIWAKRETEDSDALTYLIFSANEVESAEEGDKNTLDEINDLMRDISLHSLHPLATNSGWHVTRIMRAASPNIWKEQVKDGGVTYHIIDEKSLLACLKKGDDWDEEMLDDESN